MSNLKKHIISIIGAKGKAPSIIKKVSKRLMLFKKESDFMTSFIENSKELKEIKDTWASNYCPQRRDADGLIFDTTLSLYYNSRQGMNNPLGALNSFFTDMSLVMYGNTNGTIGTYSFGRSSEEITDLVKFNNDMNKAYVLEDNITRYIEYRAIALDKEYRIDMSNRIFYLLELTKEMKTDNIIKALDSRVDIKLYNSSEDFKKYLSKILNHYSEERQLKLIESFTKNERFLNDSVRMYSDLYIANFDNLLVDKPKDWKDIHDRLMVIDRKRQTQNIELEVDENLALLKGKKLNDWDIEFCEDAYTLLDWGIKLNNCLFSYVQRVQRGDSRIFALMEKGRIKYAVELDRVKIIQVKGKGNIDLPFEQMLQLEALLKENNVYYKKKSSFSGGGRIEQGQIERYSIELLMQYARTLGLNGTLRSEFNRHYDRDSYCLDIRYQHQVLMFPEIVPLSLNPRLNEISNIERVRIVIPSLCHRTELSARMISETPNIGEFLNHYVRNAMEELNQTVKEHIDEQKRLQGI